MYARALYQTLLAWILPGLGHLVQGRVTKAAYFGALVLGTFVLGVWLGDGASVSGSRFPFHLYGQYGAGLPTFVASLLGAEPAGRTIDRLELGVVFTTVAGIMNLVVMVDVYEWARTGSSQSQGASSSRGRSAGA